jgi:hypothetical protein
VAISTQPATTRPNFIPTPSPDFIPAEQMGGEWVTLPARWTDGRGVGEEFFWSKHCQ